MMGWEMMGGWGWLSALIAIALVVLIVVALLWLVRALGEGPRSTSSKRGAIDELQLRYARGEVDRETYLAIRRDLEADGD